MWNQAFRYGRTHPIRSVLAVVVLVMALAVLCADALLARPIRTWAERTINANLKGCTVRIAQAHPHIWKLGLDLDNVVLPQNRHPDPPVADIGALAFTLQWSRLVRFKLAGDLTLRHPALHVNLAQIQEESSSHTSLKEEGWQSAVESIYPFQLDEVRIEDGSLLYRAAAPISKPIRLTQVAQLQLDDARLTDLNTFLLSQTGVDVADGLFSVYTEITVKGGRVEGYLKPLVRNLRVSDKKKDQGKSFGKRVEMHVLQGLANLFKNRATKQVAMVTRISGPTSDPRMSQWEAIRKLLSNGLFRAILPGFLNKQNPKPAKTS